MDHDERFVGGYTGRMLASLAVGNGSISVGLLALSPLLPAIIRDLGISPARAGVALTIMWGLNALCQYPGGRLSDQLSRKTLLVGALAGIVVGFGLLAAANSFPTFLAAVAVAGACSGLFPTAAYAQLTELFSRRRGRAFGIYTAFWDVGGGASAGLALAALAVGPWQIAFAPAAVLAGIVAFALHRYSRESYAFSGASLSPVATLGRLLGDPRIRLVLVCYSLYLVTWQGAVSFLPTFLQVDKGLAPSVAGGAFAALFAVGIVAKPLSGGLADRLGRSRVALASLVVGVVGLGLLAAAEAFGTIVAGVLLFAIGLMSFSPPMLAFVMDLFPAESMGGDVGGVRAIYLGIGSLGPTLVGVAAEAVSYTAGFLGLLACLAASVVVLLYMISTE